MKDDSNIISDKQNIVDEILPPPRKRRRVSFHKKKEIVDSSDKTEQTNTGDCLMLQFPEKIKDIQI